MGSNRRRIVIRRAMLGALVATLLTIVTLPAASPAAAAETLVLNPRADAWVNKAKPATNYGSATLLRARQSASQSFLRFNLAAWQGLRVSALELRLAGVDANASGLRVQRTETSWKEAGITWKNRPDVLQSSSKAPTLGSGTARFDLRPFFPNGVIDRTLLSLRVTNNQDTLVRFGSRESSNKPRLVLTPGPRVDVVRLPSIADTWANSNWPSKNYKSATSLKVDGQPRQEAFIKFDLSAWQGHSYQNLRLDLRLSDGGGAGVAVYRVGTGWKEGGLTWNNRPTGGTKLATVNSALSTGSVSINISSAFSGGQVNAGVLGLRIVGSHADGIVFSSREGANPPILRLTPASSSPTPSPSPSPSPTPSPSPSPSPTPTPEPVYYFRGNGSDHGVGLSQHGARYRANAGQTYEQILAHYYSGTALGSIEPGLLVRIRLAEKYEPTETLPARIKALNGSWQSPAFAGRVFPVDSYLQMEKQAVGDWSAVVYDSLGVELDRLAGATDVLLEPAEPATLFEMKFRDSLRGYDRYRGQMRLRLNSGGVMAINIVAMNDYLRGVVPAEMPASWHMNAVRSQAIASRGYVYAKLRTTGFHDVLPTSADQVYGGVNIEHSRSNTAVAETDGIVVTYNGKPVQTFFFALAGGHTENNEYVFSVNSSGTPTGTPLPHLRGVPDLDAEGLPIDRNAPNFAWQSGQFTLSQLSAILANNSATNVGQLTSVSFERGVSGRAYRATLVGSGGTKTVSGNTFKSVYNANKLSGANLRSNMFFLEQVP